MSLITSGFSTQVSFDNDNVLCTSYSVSESTSPIESVAGYGAELIGTDLPIGNPYYLDYGEINGGITFHPTIDQLTNLADWIKYGRNQSKSLKVTTGTNAELSYDECYFNSITLSASEGDAVTADVGLFVLERPFNAGNNIGGLPSKVQGILPTTQILPYYNTEIIPFNDVINWNLVISQNVSTKTFCSGLRNQNQAEIPAYVLIGQMTVDLTVTILTANTPTDISSFYKDYQDSISVCVDNNPLFNFDKAVSLSNGPQIADVGNYFMVDLGYRIFKIL